MNTRKLLLTAQEISQMKGEHKVHFLNPGAVRINKSLGDAVGLQHMGIHLIQIEPGKESTEYHLHHYEEEAVYVLSGKGTLTMGDDQCLIAQVTSSVFLAMQPRTASSTMGRKHSSAWSSVSAWIRTSRITRTSINACTVIMGNGIW
ncbi:cupin domain-containing protein [Acidithiobacillus thiooxidans]|uniref:cupin domain-containing protein n=1 Tax=Acidithiobacillus thiooxidans TaxID=930 RepID=UPI00285A74E0|nr:cupin domain-containing protein [Acidithiobacillus thiooxidans]MDR7926066.1 cupin domain-containing protein [Acidithiobacillus thiooxidans]